MEQKNKGNLFYKMWVVLTPLIIYYVTYYAAFLLIIYLCNAVMEYFGGSLQAYVAEHGEKLTELVGGLSMLIGVVPLIPMFRQEVSVRRDSATKASATFLTVILAMSSSVALNVLLSLTGLVRASESYQNVASHQYSVVFGVGAILFGLISPIAEEIVFRGLIFNRMQRYYPTTAAIIGSSVLFGVYHGNLVQGLYGGCMGILLSYTYKRTKSFFIPCLFHATANLTVYTLTYAQGVYRGLQEMIFTAAGCVILFVISAVCVCLMERQRVDVNNKI